jgi:2-polyprenyl-3-methyl-5-hydroxy-6-metoxy-1,4-benzoquinol methylase
MKAEIVKCPICKSNESRPKWQFNSWKVVRCKKCGFHYTNPRPPTEELSSYYSESYYTDERHRSKFYEEGGEVKIEQGQNYLNRIADLEHYAEIRGKVLEIGAARGGYLIALKNRGWDVHGVEISADAVGKAKTMYDLDLFCGSLDQFQSAYLFDAVLMYQTLEHVPDPAAIIDKSASLLKNDGLLIVEVPNLDSFDFKTNRSRREMMLDLPRHLVHFDKKSLCALIKSKGFTILEVNLYLPFFVLKWLNRPVRPSFTPEEVVKNKESIPAMMTKSYGWKLGVLKILSSVLPGWRITVIAKKTEVH